MNEFDDPVDPPGGWQRDHIDRYVASEGEDGHVWHGVPTLLLTTIGRRTGRPRRTPLIYGRDGDRYLVIASNGGSPEHPDWYQNLAAYPRVQLQVGSERFEATASNADPAERARLWPIMTALWPAYDEYQQQTGREIPLVILTRV